MLPFDLSESSLMYLRRMCVIVTLGRAKSTNDATTNASVLLAGWGG